MSTGSGNVFLGFDGTAASIRGDNNVFSGNYVGTDASGKVPVKQTDPDLICTTVDWLGGGGAVWALWAAGPDDLSACAGGRVD